MYFVGLYLLNCLLLVAGFEDYFEFNKFPEMNAELKKQQGAFSTKMRNYLSSGETTKFYGPYDDCVRLKNRTTIIKEMEVKFQNIQLCGASNRVLLDFEPYLEFGAVSFKFRFNRLYLKLSSISQNIGSSSQQFTEYLVISMEDVIVEGASGVAIDQLEKSWKTSTWTQEISYGNLYLERETNHPSSRLKLNDTILTTNTIGRLFKYESYRLIMQELQHQIDVALDKYPISDVFNSHRLLTEFKSQVLNMNKFANRFVDNLINETRAYIRENNQQIASIPDYNTRFSREWGPLTVWGEIAASRGYVGDLSTIQRTANFTILPLRKAKLLKVFGALGLENLEFGYADYEAHVWNVGPKGRINAKTEKNSIAFYFKGGLNAKSGSLDVRTFDVNIVDFENTKIKATGLGPFNYIYSIALSRIAENGKDDVLPIIERSLGDMIAQQMGDGFALQGIITH